MAGESTSFKFQLPRETPRFFSLPRHFSSCTTVMKGTVLPELPAPSPGWGAEGIHLANQKRMKRRDLARDLLLQQQEGRSDRPGKKPEMPGGRRGGAYAYARTQHQKQQSLPQKQQQQHQRQDVAFLPQSDTYERPDGRPSSTEIVLRSNNASDVIQSYESQSLERLLIEERTKRSLMQAELERVSALAQRNQMTMRDRSSFLEKLRLRDAAELRSLRERLQQVEQELAEHRAAGLSSVRNQSAQNLIIRGPEKQRSSDQRYPRAQVAGNNDGVSKILTELRTRDHRDTLVLEKQEQKRMELWEQGMALQRRVEEQRQQMSEFALRSADRIAAIESRLNERDASIIRLEQRESGTSQQMAMREVQSEATVSSLLSSMERLQAQLAQEKQMRVKMEEAHRANNAELRKLIVSSEKNMASSIQSNVDQLWQKDNAHRSRAKQVSEFVEQRHLHERDSVYQWAERLEATLAAERNDRLRFEKEMRTMTELRVAAIEAGAVQAKISNELHGSDIEKKTEKVLSKLIK